MAAFFACSAYVAARLSAPVPPVLPLRAGRLGGREGVDQQDRRRLRHLRGLHDLHHGLPVRRHGGNFQAGPHHPPIASPATPASKPAPAAPSPSSSANLQNRPPGSSTRRLRRLRVFCKKVGAMVRPALLRRFARIGWKPRDIYDLGRNCRTNAPILFADGDDCL